MLCLHAVAGGGRTLDAMSVDISGVNRKCHFLRAVKGSCNSLLGLEEGGQENQSLQS